MRSSFVSAALLAATCAAAGIPEPCPAKRCTSVFVHCHAADAATRHESCRHVEADTRVLLERKDLKQRH